MSYASSSGPERFPPPLPLYAFRITALYLSLARDLGPKQLPELDGGRRRPTSFGSIPSFPELLSQLRTSFGLDEDVDLALEQVEFTFDPTFPSSWAQWQHYRLVPYPLILTEDRLVLGRFISSSKGWETMLEGRKGKWGSEFVTGHLVVKVVSPSREGCLGRIRQLPLRHQLPAHSSPPPFDPITTFHLEPEVPFTFLDYELKLRILPVDYFTCKTFSGSRTAIRVTLSNGFQTTQALVFNGSGAVEELMTASYSLVEVLEQGPKGVLVVRQTSPTYPTQYPRLFPTPSDVSSKGAGRVSRLPTDIVDIILSFVSATIAPYAFAQTSRLKTGLGILRTASLLNREWNEIATPYLYRHIIDFTLSKGVVGSLILQSNSSYTRFTRTLQAPFRSRTACSRDRARGGTLPRFIPTSTFPSLVIIRGLVIGPPDVSVLALLARSTPHLRELQAQITFAYRDSPSFLNAPGITAIDLPPSLESLSLSLDVGLSIASDILEKLVVSGRTFGGDAIQRYFPVLRRLHLEFVVRGAAVDDRSPIFPNPPLPFLHSSLSNLLDHLGPNLLELGLAEHCSYKDRRLPEAPPLPSQILLAAPSLRILAVDGLRLQGLLLDLPVYRSLEQIDIGPSDLTELNQEELSFGGAAFKTRSTQSHDGGILREVSKHFSRRRFPNLKRVRLTSADWKFGSHRKFGGRLVRFLKGFGLELVDYDGIAWYEN